MWPSSRFVLLCSVFALILLNFFNSIVDHAIIAHAKLGQCALAIEGILATIMDTLGYNDTKTALNINTMLTEIKLPSKS